MGFAIFVLFVKVKTNIDRIVFMHKNQTKSNKHSTVKLIEHMVLMKYAVFKIIFYILFLIQLFMHFYLA